MIGFISGNTIWHRQWNVQTTGVTPHWKKRESNPKPINDHDAIIKCKFKNNQKFPNLFWFCLVLQFVQPFLECCLGRIAYLLEHVPCIHLRQTILTYQFWQYITHRHLTNKQTIFNYFLRLASIHVSVTLWRLKMANAMQNNNYYSTTVSFKT